MTMKNDLIRRQDAIEALLKEANAEGAYGYISGEQVKKVLNTLPSAEQGWIPVSERLPEGNKPVLVTHHGKYQAFVSVDWIDPNTNEWNRTCNVTAWRPKPEPWKGEKDAEVH